MTNIDKLTCFNEVIDELRTKKRHDKQPVEEPQNRGTIQVFSNMML